MYHTLACLKGICSRKKVEYACAFAIVIAARICAHLTYLLLSFHHVFCLCFGCRYCFSHVVVFLPATMGFGEPNPTYSVNRRRHCGLISELQELIIRMSESDLNTYKLQLQQVEAALTTDPENEVLLPEIFL